MIGERPEPGNAFRNRHGRHTACACYIRVLGWPYNCHSNENPHAEREEYIEKRDTN
jgi:hypothetical protein